MVPGNASGQQMWGWLLFCAPYDVWKPSLPLSVRSQWHPVVILRVSASLPSLQQSLTSATLFLPGQCPWKMVHLVCSVVVWCSVVWVWCVCTSGMQVCMHTCEHTCGGKRTISGVALQGPSFETRPLTGLELNRYTMLGSLRAKGISLSGPLQHWDYKHTQPWLTSHLTTGLGVLASSYAVKHFTS